MSEKVEGKKKWYKSKGVWGGIVAVVAGMAGQFFGVDIGEDTQDKLASQIPAAIGVVGGLVAIIGRIVAQDKVD